LRAKDTSAVAAPGETRPPSTTRAERALTTRRRMVRAAYDLFCHDGYVGTTIAGVAERAGVAVPTIYYSFGTKANVLDAALGAAIMGFDEWREAPPEPQIAALLPMHTWWRQFHEMPTARDALTLFVASGTDILGRVAPLMPALHGATGDPDAAQVVRVAFERQVESYRHSLAVVAAKPPGLRAGIDLDAATDAMLALFSADAYHALARRGWSHHRCTTFFEEILAAHLLPPNETRATDGGRHR